MIRDTVLPSEVEKDTIYIGLQHIQEGNLILNGHGYADDVTSQKTHFQKGDILFGKLRPYFRKVIRAPFNGICSTDIWVVRQSSNNICLEFLYYLMASQEFIEFATLGSEGTRMPRAKWEHVSRFEIRLPTLVEQQAITALLCSLDAKIELNGRMNKTLEEMVQVLFKSWFVDFDPVRAKIEGRWQPGQSLPGLPAELYNLLPDCFVSSEIGEIPRGWTVVSLSEAISELVSGSRPRGGAVKSGIPSIGAENILGLGLYNYSKEKFIPDDFYAKLEKRGANVRNGDVLLYKDGAHVGRKTYFDCNFPHTKCVVNEHVFIVRLNKPIMQKYLFFWLDQDWVTGKIIGLNSNSAQPGINKSGVGSLPFLVPPLNIIELFEQMVSPLIHSIFTRALESITLSNIRDTLLPKLLSGEIRVDDLENLPANGTERKDAPRPDR